MTILREAWAMLGEELLGMTVFDFRPDFSLDMWPDHFRIH